MVNAKIASGLARKNKIILDKKREKAEQIEKDIAKKKYAEENKYWIRNVTKLVNSQIDQTIKDGGFDTRISIDFGATNESVNIICGKLTKSGFQVFKDQKYAEPSNGDSENGGYGASPGGWKYWLNVSWHK